MTPLLLLALAAEGPGDFMPSRAFDLTHLDLALRVDPGAGTVEGTATHTVRPLPRAAGWLTLHQEGLDIRAVRLDGAPVEGWRLGHGTVHVPMPSDGAVHRVALDYAATPELGLHFRRPGGGRPDRVIEVWSQGQDADHRHWIPAWDYPNDRFTYTGAFTVPARLTVASNGVRTGSRQAEPGWKTETFALEQELPTYLIALVVGDYRVYTEEAAGTPLEYLVAADVPEAEARVAGGFAAPQIAYFGELLGTPYPWPIYRQAFVQRFMYGGMENTSLTINTDAVLGEHPVDRERAEGLVAHELAHQWFGDLVTCYGWRDRWLNEGFATMYASRWTEKAHGRAYYDAQVHDRMVSAAAYTTPMARRSWSPAGPDSAGVYDRGMMVLHMLRTHLGDAVYDAGVRLYLERHAHDFVETADLRRALEDVGGEHLGWLFDAWVHGAGVPEIRTGWTWSDGQLTVTLAQDGEAWSAPVEIEVGAAAGAQTRTIWLAEGEARLVWDQDTPPAYVAVDPRGGVLARWTRAQPPAAWVAQAERATTPYARLVAFEHLGRQKATPEAVAVLGAALKTDLHPRYRGKAAEALGALGTPEALAALAPALEDPDERVRADALTSLGRFPVSQASLRALRAGLSDDSAHVRGAAVAAMATHDPGRGVRAARRSVEREDESRRRWEHAAAVAVLGEHGEAEDAERLGRLFSRRTPSRLLSSAVEAAGRIVAGLEGRRAIALRSGLSRRLEPLLDSDDFRVRAAAVRGLGLLGDAPARARLLALASTTEVDRLGESAREAASRILEGPALETEPSSEADPDALEQRLDAVEARLRKLEVWRR